MSSSLSVPMTCIFFNSLRLLFLYSFVPSAKCIIMFCGIFRSVNLTFSSMFAHPSISKPTYICLSLSYHFYLLRRYMCPDCSTCFCHSTEMTPSYACTGYLKENFPHHLFITSDQIKVSDLVNSFDLLLIFNLMSILSNLVLNHADERSKLEF